MDRMEYVQESITTLHDLSDTTPDAPTERTAVVVPMTTREYPTPAAGVFSALSTVAPATVVVSLRAPRERVAEIAAWLDEFRVPIELLWCNGPALEALLADRGLAGKSGKGRDVWLALGLASQYEFVVIHDADAISYSTADVPKLCAPLANGDFDFVKGYYARVERDRLFGRLFRLFYVPLVAALYEYQRAEVLDYLSGFRYALAGEVGLTGDLAQTVRLGRGWGLEVDMLESAFESAEFSGTAQVDLGVDVHDHREVSGESGLAAMSRAVGRALLRAVEAHGVDPAYETLPARYERAAARFIDQYAADARYNGLDYDPDAEREQVEAYARAIAPPRTDARLPAWTDAPLEPRELRKVVKRDLAATRN